MSPTPRAAWFLGALAIAAVVLPGLVVVLLGLALAATVAVDMAAARPRAAVTREVPTVLARGVASIVVVRTTSTVAVRVRQPAAPDIEIFPAEGDAALDAVLVARRRGRHLLPGVVVRSTGPLGLGRVDRRGTDPLELVVYPDLPSARAVVALVRQGRISGDGRRRGALGIGTDFDLVRDYSPDDDVRQVNWRATARVGRPMSNQYRLDQDRDVLCVVDAGRLMAAPLGDRTRLDAALDAVTAVALVADEVGDRCGAVAFDAEIRRRVLPRRGGSRAVVDALFDLEPSSVDSDYERAFRTLGGKRACVLVFTDLVEPAAARPLLEAMPWLVRHHAVIVASSRDTDLADLLASEPSDSLAAYAAAVTVDVLDARAVVTRELVGAGAVVVEVAPAELGTACVAAYLRLKSRALV